MHAESTSQSRDTLPDGEESTARVPLFAQNLARRLVGMNDVVLAPPAQSATYAVVPAPSRPRALAVRPRIRPLTPRDPSASIAEDESTSRIPAHEIAEHLDAAESAVPSTMPVEFFKSAPSLEVAEPLPLSRSGVVEALPRIQSAPSLEVFESYADEEEETQIANDNVVPPVAPVLELVAEPSGELPNLGDESSAEVAVIQHLTDEPSGEAPELSDEEIAASLGLAPAHPAPARRGAVFPWIASSIIAVASVAVCYATVVGAISGHAVARVPHMPMPPGVHACIADMPVRTLAINDASSVARRESVSTPRRRAAAPARLSASMRVPPATGIVRDLPF